MIDSDVLIMLCCFRRIHVHYITLWDCESYNTQKCTEEYEDDDTQRYEEVERNSHHRCECDTTNSNLHYTDVCVRWNKELRNDDLRQRQANPRYPSLSHVKRILITARQGSFASYLP